MFRPELKPHGRPLASNARCMDDRAPETGCQFEVDPVETGCKDEELVVRDQSTNRPGISLPRLRLHEQRRHPPSLADFLGNSAYHIVEHEIAMGLVGRLA